mgnify:CR=1 FL=1
MIKMASIGAVVLLAAGMAACGKKTEAVITTDGEEFSEPEKEYPTVAQSRAKKFSYNDLAVDSVKYLMNEQAVKNSLGEPIAIYNSSEKQNTENVVKEKVYSYNDLTLIFSEIDGEYKLTAAASVSNQDVFSRGLKVGDNIDRVYDLYYRDVNCMNNEYYSEDKTTALGKMLYGNFTIDALDTIKTTNKVEYGIINYNGYSSLETAASYIIEFTYFEPPYKNGYAQIDDDFAQMSVDVDSDGTITGIRWYYYPQE